MVLTNAAAKAMLDTRLFLENGRLAAGGPDVLQKLIATCARGICAVDGPGGEFKIPREFPRSPLHVTVTPLRSEAQLADIPWIGTGFDVKKLDWPRIFMDCEIQGSSSSETNRAPGTVEMIE